MARLDAVEEAERAFLVSQVQMWLLPKVRTGCHLTLLNVPFPGGASDRVLKYRCVEVMSVSSSFDLTSCFLSFF